MRKLALPPAYLTPTFSILDFFDITLKFKDWLTRFKHMYENFREKSYGNWKNIHKLNSAIIFTLIKSVK